jgi:hypothetical protein
MPKSRNRKPRNKAIHNYVACNEETLALRRIESIASHHQSRRRTITYVLNVVEELARTLQEHPTLATRRLSRGLTPLTILKEHISLLPGARNSTHPLEAACVYPQIPPGVIPMLAHYCSPRNDPFLSEDLIFTLIHALLRRRATDAGQVQQQQQDVEALVNAAVGAGYFTSCDESTMRQTSLLEWAFLVCGRSAIMQFLIRICPNVSDIEIVPQVGFDLHSSVADLVPQLVKLTIEIFPNTISESSSMSPWKKFTKELGQNEKLEKLDLFFNKDSPPSISTTAFQPLAAAVLTLLKHNTLKYLSILNSNSNNSNSNDGHKEIFDALKDNTSLQLFHVPCWTDTNQKLKALLTALKDKNRTLIAVQVIDEGCTLGKHLDPSLPSLIQYHCKLNLLGLAVAHDPHTQITRLLSIVENAMSSNWGVLIDGDTAVGFAYALLRPCPSIWLVNFSTADGLTQR